jgi:hypothetical protein
VKRSIVLIIFFVMTLGIASALTLSNATGSWVNAVGTNGAPSCLHTFQQGAESLLTYGTTTGSCPPSGSTSSQSGFGFIGTQNQTFNPDDVFLLGQLNHYNNQLIWPPNPSIIQSVDLEIDLSFSDPLLDATITFKLTIDETTNIAPCLYPSPEDNPCSDKVELTTTDERQTFSIGGIEYTLIISGFVPGQLQSCQFDPGNTINFFISDEGQVNSACLFARVVEFEPPGEATGNLEVTKTVDWSGATPDTAQTFEICVTGPSFATPNCQTTDFDGGILLWPDVLAGTYEVSENVANPEDWMTTLPALVQVVIDGTASAQVVNQFIAPPPEETPEVPPEATPKPKRTKVFVTICHVAGRADEPANYIVLTIPEQALNGHFYENGTPKAGHEEDFLILTPEDLARCAPPDEQPESTPEATPDTQP